MGTALPGPVHDLQAQLIDAVSFCFVNGLQMRARAGKHSAEEMVAYTERCQSMDLPELYAIPDGARAIEFPEDGGGCQISSPLPGHDFVENNQVHLNFWPGPEGWGSPVMFMLHGVMSVSDVGYRLWAKKLNQLGWSAVFFHLPYHYGRKPRGVFSGELALTANLIRTAEAIRQAVVELRWVIREMKRHGAERFGIWGTSYGGWIGSLLCVLESSISTAWLLEPIVDVDTAIWESPASRTIQKQLQRRRISRDLVRQHLPNVCPSFHVPAIDPRKILFVAGTFDRIAPPHTLKALQKAWPGSHYEEFRQGHVGYQLMPQSLRLACERFPELFVCR